MEFGRLKYSKPIHYNGGVLLGNWVEDRNCYVKNSYKYKTTYDSFYTTKPYVESNAKIVWDNTFRDEGYGREIVFDHDGLNYTDNYSTTYDLSYNHLPKFFRTNPAYKERADLILNYGPITNRGLRQIKMNEWHNQKADPRVTVNSVYRDTYIVPDNLKPPVIFNKKCPLIPGETSCNPITWKCDGEIKLPKKNTLRSIKKRV